MEELVTGAAKALAPLTHAVGRKVSQLQAERAAAKEPFRLQPDLLNQKLNETLSRFLGGTVDDAWWRRVLSRMEQAYVVPEFFKMPRVQRWLGEEYVQEGIVSLARANIMGQLPEREDETRGRLSESYAEHTGEPKCFAKGNYLGRVAAFLKAVVSLHRECSVV